MLKLKYPLKPCVSYLVKYNQFSYSVQKVQKNISMIKSDIKQNEIVTDKFKNELKYIVERNKKPIKYETSKNEHIFSTSETASAQSNNTDLQLTNIYGTLQTAMDVPESSSKALENSFDGGSQKNNSNSTTMRILDLKKVLPVYMTSVKIEKANYQTVSNQIEQTFQIDLATVVVPLSLHNNMGNNHLVSSVIQDVHDFYVNASEKIICVSLKIQHQSRTWYKELNKFFKQPGTPQNLLREQLMSQLIVFKEKSAAISWLCEAKESSTGEKTENPVATSESLTKK